MNNKNHEIKIANKKINEIESLNNIEELDLNSLETIVGGLRRIPDKLAPTPCTNDGDDWICILHSEF